MTKLEELEEKLTSARAEALEREAGPVAELLEGWPVRTGVDQREFHAAAGQDAGAVQFAFDILLKIVGETLDVADAVVVGGLLLQLGAELHFDAGRRWRLNRQGGAGQREACEGG